MKSREDAPEPDAFAAVARFVDPVAAQLARSLLEADGIPCFLQGEGIGSLPPYGLAAGIRLLVPAARAGRATEILAEASAGDPEGEAETAG